MLPGVVHFLFKVLQSSFNKRRKQCHAFFFSFPPGLGFIFILSLTSSFFLYWIALLFQRFTQRWWFFLFPPFFSPHTFSLPICPTVQTCCLYFSSPMLTALFLWIPSRGFSPFGLPASSSTISLPLCSMTFSSTHASS